MTIVDASNDAAVREQAYLLWEQEGRPDGREMEFWTRAQVKVAEGEQLTQLTKPAPKRAKAAKADGATKGAATKVKAAPTKAVKAKTEKADAKAKPKKK
jgi:hypothetical protein